MRKLLLCGVSALALQAGLAGSSSAAQLVETPITFTGFGNSSGSLATSLVFPKFDSNLGTLDSVLVVTELTSNSSIAGHRGNYRWASATTTSSTTSNVTPSAKAVASLTGGPTQLAGAAAVSVTASGPAQTVIGLTNYQFTASASNANLVGQQTVTPSPLSDWEAPGGGTDPLILAVTTTASPSFLAFNWPGGGPEFTYTLDLTYDYTASAPPPPPPPPLLPPPVITPPPPPGPVSTPEPASIMLLGAGLFGLGAARRRRKR